MDAGAPRTPQKQTLEKSVAAPSGTHPSMLAELPMSSTCPQTFGIARAVLGSPPFLEIGIQEYQMLDRAKSLLTHVVSIEEKYDLVTANYIELENNPQQHCCRSPDAG